MNSSEVVSQSELNLPNGTDDTKLSLRSTECLVAEEAVQSSKDVTVESIWNVYFEDDGLIFEDGRAFLNREIFVEVCLTSDVAEDKRSVSVNVSALSDKARGIRIHERRAVEEVVRAG